MCIRDSHLTVSVSRNSAKKLSIDRVRQPKQYSLEFPAEGEQGRHVPNMTRQRVPGSCCRSQKHVVTQCRTASCRYQQSRHVSRSVITSRSKAGNWTNGVGKVRVWGWAKNHCRKTLWTVDVIHVSCRRRQWPVVLCFMKFNCQMFIMMTMIATLWNYIYESHCKNETVLFLSRTVYIYFNNILTAHVYVRTLWIANRLHGWSISRESAGDFNQQDTEMCSLREWITDKNWDTLLLIARRFTRDRRL